MPPGGRGRDMEKLTLSGVTPNHFVRKLKENEDTDTCHTSSSERERKTETESRETERI
jgi:hypothetical protein